VLTLVVGVWPDRRFVGLIIQAPAVLSTPVAVFDLSGDCPSLPDGHRTFIFLERFFGERIGPTSAATSPPPARSTHTGAAGNFRPLRLLQNEPMAEFRGTRIKRPVA